MEADNLDLLAEETHPTLLQAALTAGAHINADTGILEIPRAQSTVFPYKPLSHHELGIKGYTKRHACIGNFETIVFDDAGKEHVIWRHPHVNSLFRNHTYPRAQQYVKSYLGIDFEGVVVAHFRRKEHIVWRADLGVVKRLFEELGKLTKASIVNEVLLLNQQLKTLLIRKRFQTVRGWMFFRWREYSQVPRVWDAPNISHLYVLEVEDFDRQMKILSRHGVIIKFLNWFIIYQVTCVDLPDSEQGAA